MGTAIRPRDHAMIGHRRQTQLAQRKGAHRKDQQVSVTVVLFFTVASAAISVYDLVLFFKLLVM